MYGAWHDWLSYVVAVFFASGTITLIDDYLNADVDICHGRRTLAARLGKAALPYIALTAVLSSAAQLQLAVGLFLASHAVGMIPGWRSRRPFLPFGITEMIMSIGLSVLISGAVLSLWSVSIMVLLHCIDGLVSLAAAEKDPNGDSSAGTVIGGVRLSMIALCALLAAVLTNAFDTVVAMAVITTIRTMSEFTTRHLWKTTDDEQFHTHRT